MSEQKKTRADVIAEIQKTNALLQTLIDELRMARTSAVRNTRSTVGGGSAGGSGGASQGGSGGGGAAV